MKIFVNGKEKMISDKISSLTDFIKIILENEKGKIIELNGKVIKKGEIEGISLRDGDRIELIQFMGGG
ncbi:MAG: sulfur carrier protein ThiS [Candidatus Aminicenantes bacterium]|nr:sulfur carrier protein ThiS [Candidatus Aminicenantes bacterium]